MLENEYSQDFQIKLLIHLVLDPRLYDATRGQLRVDDFGLPACRLIYETVMQYHDRYKRLPSFSILETEILRCMNDTSGNILTQLNTSDQHALGVILGMLARTRIGELDPAYFSDRLPGFLAFVRLNSQIANAANIKATDFIASVLDIDKSLASLGSTRYEYSDIMTHIPDAEGSARPRIGWGVRGLDSLLGGGLTQQQIGLVTACTGVGKTTTMLGMAVNAAIRGHQALFITCELPRNKILERGQMMLCGIDAKWFKRPKSKWPIGERLRWNYMASAESPLAGGLKVIERIGNCTVFEIDRMINNWKDDTARAGKDPEKCTLVCVDWLDRLDPSGIARVGKDASDERTNFRVLEKLDEFKTKHNIVLWTATQAGKSGEGKEVLTRKDTSWGQSKHHLMDASIGVAPKVEGRESANVEDTFLSDVPNEDQSLDTVLEDPPCDRELVISMMKTRDTSTEGQSTRVYQGPTLKLWNQRADAQAYDRVAAGGDPKTTFQSMYGKLKQS